MSCDRRNVGWVWGNIFFAHLAFYSSKWLKVEFLQCLQEGEPVPRP